MSSAIITLSVLALVIFFGIIVTAMKMLRGIRAVNWAIYGALIIFWIAVAIGQERSASSRFYDFYDWRFPLAAVVVWITQAVVRIPLGYFSRHLQSRKVPIALAFVTFTFLTVPFLVVANATTWWILAVGVGVFSATFGLDLIYVAENWSKHRVFITVGAISLLPFIGLFITTLTREIVVITSGTSYQLDNAMRYLLVSAIVIALVSGVWCWMKVPENKETMRWEVTEHSSLQFVERLNHRDLLVLATLLVGSGFVGQVMTREETTGLLNGAWPLVNVGCALLSGLVAIIVAWVLVRRVRVVTLTTCGHILLLTGVIIAAISAFGHFSPPMGLVGLVLVTTGLALYETAVYGMVIHFDLKNRMLVTAVCLTIRSLACGAGDLVGGEVATLALESWKWLMLAMVIFSIGISGIIIWVHHRVQIAFTVTDFYENVKINPHVRVIWKKLALTRTKG